MKKYLLWLIIPWLVWACNSSPNSPSQPTTFSAEYVSSWVKLEAKTSTDHQGLHLNLSITNIADITIYPETESLGHSLIFTVYDSYGDEISSFYDQDFERDYRDLGLKTGFAYANTYLISQGFPTTLRYGKVKVRLNVQNSYGAIGPLCELWINYDFGNY